MEIDEQGGLRVLRLGAGLNAFDDAFVADLDDALDRVEADASATVLVTTGEGKHYSNGFDLEFLGGLDRDGRAAYIGRTSRMLARILTFPIPTVAALNGHAFGIGAVLALAHDQRVANNDRGWFCLPEVDIGLRFTPFFLAVVTGTLSTATASDAVLSGRRYDAQAALDAGIVDAAATPGSVVEVAASIAEDRAGKSRDVVQTLKRDLRAATLAQL